LFYAIVKIPSLVKSPGFFRFLAFNFRSFGNKNSTNKNLPDSYKEVEQRIAMD